MANFFEAASHFDLDPTPLATKIEEGKYLSRSDGDGMTLLHYAAREGHTEAVRMLLEAGVSLEQQDRDGRTPLHLACMMCGKGMTRGDGHVFIIDILQSNYALTSAQDNYGYRPMAYLPAGVKALGIKTPSVDGTGARWEVQEVLKGGAVLKGSVAVAAELVK